MPAVYDINKHINGKEEEIGSIIAQQYDLILNGYEIGGGSVRAHKAEILEATYKNMGYNKEEMIKSVGTMNKAFQYGAPPHGGLAFGFDRLCSLFGGQDSIRDFIAFPKNNRGRDMMIDAPSNIDQSQLDELNLISKPVL